MSIYRVGLRLFGRGSLLLIKLGSDGLGDKKRVISLLILHTNNSVVHVSCCELCGHTKMLGSGRQP